MTNKKFKSKQIGYNMILTDVVHKNFEILSRIYVAMNDVLKIGRPRIEHLIGEYVDKVIGKYSDVDADTQKILIDKSLACRNLSRAELTKYVIGLYPNLIESVAAVLGENIAIWYIWINEQCGIGRNRFLRVLEHAAALDSDYAIDECEKCYGIKFKDIEHLQDADRCVKRSAPKLHSDQFRQKQRELEAFRIITEKVV